MKICKYCNSTQKAEGQIFMLPFTEDHSGNLTLISAQQSFRGCIYLSILDLWMSRSVTLTFYLIIIFRSVKAEIQICSSFTTPVVFNCTSSRQGIQNKIREKKKVKELFLFSLTAFWEALWCHCVMMTVTHIPRRPEYPYRCPSASAFWNFLWKLCMHTFQVPRERSKEYDVYRV